MGGRYTLTLECAVCGTPTEVYYAPSSGFLHFTCVCGAINRIVQDFYTEIITQAEVEADIEKEFSDDVGNFHNKL